MPSLNEFRSGKPGFYPDQSVYAEYACAEFGLSFQDIDGGSGLLFRVASNKRSVHFGAGRCSWYPQNDATAATLASDKYFTNRILEDAGVATLGGEYFFLHDRRRSHRAPGHEREDAFAYLRELGGAAFAKPLLGSRGDFAKSIGGEVLLAGYLDEVSQYYDSILIQPIATGNEYRIFLLEDEVVAVHTAPDPLEVEGINTRAELALAAAALRDRVNEAHMLAGVTIVDPASTWIEVDV